MRPGRNGACGCPSNGWRPSGGGDRVSGDDPEMRETARRKLVGRAVVIGFLLLVAIYAIATFVR